MKQGANVIERRNLFNTNCIKKKKKERQLLGFPVTINDVPKATKVQLKKLNLFTAHMHKNKGQERKQG